MVEELVMGNEGKRGNAQRGIRQRSGICHLVGARADEGSGVLGEDRVPRDGTIESFEYWRYRWKKLLVIRRSGPSSLR